MNTAAPYKLLLNNNNRVEGKRSNQELQILIELMKNNAVFNYLNLPEKTIKQLCNHLVLIWAENPHIIESNNHQAYFILEGKGFEYMDNQSQTLKAKYFQGNDYLMVRKLSTADFFIVNSPPDRFHSQSSIKKYQLMIDQGTLVGKIQGQSYYQYLEYYVNERYKKINSLFKKIQALKGLPNPFFYEIGRHLQHFTVQKDQYMIEKTQKDPFVYFIEKGSLQLTVQNSQKREKSPKKINLIANKKQQSKYIIKQNEIFGINSLNSTSFDVQENYSVKASQNCSFYRIQKRIFAMIISSFQQIIKRTNNLVSSVNLNEQIQGKDSEERNFLIKNVLNIRNSEKKTRDLKLKAFSSPQKKNFVSVDQNFTQNSKTTLESKFRSTHTFSNIKIDQSLEDNKFSKTFYPQFTSTQFKDSVENKVFQIQVDMDRQKARSSSLKPVNSFNRHYKRKSQNLIRPAEQDNLIRSYYQNKLKNEMMKKAGMILQRNMNHRSKVSQPARRALSLKDFRTRSQNNKRQLSTAYRPLTREINSKQRKQIQISNLAKFVENSKNNLQQQARKMIERKIIIQPRPMKKVVKPKHNMLIESK